MAYSLFDVLQFLMPLILIAAPWNLGLPVLIQLGATYVAVILASSAIGAMVAVVAGSSGESHLLAVLSVLVVVALSGLFWKTVVGLSTGIFLPFQYFRDVLMTGVIPFHGGIVSLLAGLALTGVALLISPHLFRIA
jgi:hypothetical protein